MVTLTVGSPGALVAISSVGGIISLTGSLLFGSPGILVASSSEAGIVIYQEHY